jgi:type IV secretory pathway VirD2 relaxase
VSDQIRRPQGGVVLPLGALSAHVAYLERDGVTRDGEKGCMFGATEDRTDAMAFVRRGLQRPASFPLHRHAGGCRRDD